MVIKNCWHNRPVFSRVIGALQEHDGSDPLTALTFATEVSGPRRGRRAEVGRPPRRGPDFLALAASRKGRGTLLVVCSAAGVTLPGVPPPPPSARQTLGDSTGLSHASSAFVRFFKFAFAQDP